MSLSSVVFTAGLLGAASFIVSCVAGSMCIIKPFKVEPIPFIRDVGFFTIAVTMLTVFLWDGLIHAWEAGALVGLYFTYVLVVIIGTWWDRRRAYYRSLEATERNEYVDEQTSLLGSGPYRDDRACSDLCIFPLLY